jgi:hypothetical protein
MGERRLASRESPPLDKRRQEIGGYPKPHWGTQPAGFLGIHRRAAR